MATVGMESGAESGGIEPMQAEALPALGEGATLAYVPGLDGSGEMLFGTAERLAQHFRLLRFRYVGTEAPGAGLYDRLADDIAASLPETPSLVLAESFGGAVALSVALRAPERVGALALVNTFAHYPRRALIRVGARVAPWTPDWALSLGRGGLSSLLFFRPRVDPEAEAGFRRMQPGFQGGGYPGRIAAIRELDLRPRLGEVRVPCALFASSHDRVVPSLDTMRVLQQGLPDARLEVLQKAGHVVLPLADEPWVERLLALQRRISEQHHVAGG